MIHFMVVEFFGIDVMKVDTTKFIHLIKAEEKNIRVLRGYKASIRLKEYITQAMKSLERYQFIFYRW